MSLDPTHIAAIRTEYRRAALSEDMTGPDPLHFFRRWFDEAIAAGAAEVNAMTLATVDEAGNPRARIVLLKEVGSEGFVFYTNYRSDKGRELLSHPRAALVFFWQELERQVRVEGQVHQVDPAVSDRYFHSRPAESRIGAWASRQSTVVGSREELEQEEKRFAGQFADGEIPRPGHWGGFCLVPDRIEFWQGRPGRLHDRIVFGRTESSEWNRFRLAP